MARVVVLGRSGSGKSYFAGKKLIDILDRDGEDAFERAIHIDLEDEERGLSLKEDPLLLTYEVDKRDIRSAVVYPNRHEVPDYIPDKELEDGLTVLAPKWVFYKNKYIRVVPDGLTTEEMRYLVEVLADAAMKAGDTHFSMDEAHLVADQHDMGDKLMRLVTGGRKRGIEWLFITQRPQRLHEDVLSQTNYTVYFQLTSNRDVKKAADSAEAFDAKEVLPGLGQRKAIVENFDTGEATVIDTDGLDRKYPHKSGDDGRADEAWQDDEPHPETIDPDSFDQERVDTDVEEEAKRQAAHYPGDTES